MREKLIVGNWKMNPQTSAQAVRLFADISRRVPKGVSVVICPPFPYIPLLSKRNSKRVALGAQDCFWEEKGPYTGEISPVMLRRLGIKYVIVGHSKRREVLEETDSMIAKKVRAALRAGLKVILCVGEPLSVRRKGVAAAKRFVRSQLKKDLVFLNPKSRIPNSKLIVAYEPIWAISTAKHHKDENPEDASEMISYIKNLLHTTYHLPSAVLYGGSVDGKNVNEFLSQPGVDGALVGRVSLRSKEFARIIRITGSINE